jgi:SAM-dependent MidA family methyltransferase
MRHNLILHDILCSAVRQAPNQRITFANFMDVVLYHPQAGYYATQTSAIGPQGDFVTSSHVSHDFGELLAEQFVELWHNLGAPQPFLLVEMGAGQGIFAADVLGHLHARYPACFAALQYTIVEKSEILKVVQQKRLATWVEKLTWLALEDIPDDSVMGCFFSNELVDALPVHQVVLTEAGLQEVYVTLAEHGATFQEVIAPLSTPRLLDYFDLVGVNFSDSQYQVGYRTEAHLAALDWIQAVAQKLHQGYVITVDYGYPANRYYNRSRFQGTLQCYYQHAHHNDPYSNLGYQDITAHVNFTALERYGEQYGLKTLGVTQQAMFLMALGLGDRLTALANLQGTDSKTLHEAIQRREHLHQLINPMGLGNFLILVQSKDTNSLLPGQSITGLTVPPLL